MIYHNGHNDLVGLQETVDNASRRLAREYKYGRFDSIVVTGMSGVIVGAPVAVETGIPLMIVRKDDDKNNHSYNNVINAEAYRSGRQRILFLDDLIDSGKTLHSVHDALKKVENREGYPFEICGIFAYKYAPKDFDVLRPAPFRLLTWNTNPVDYDGTYIRGLIFDYQKASRVP